MTRAEEILLKEMRYIASISNGQVRRVADRALAYSALASAREYLATEPSGERAALIELLRDLAPKLLNGRMVAAAADMLEADADLLTQLARRTVERNMVIGIAVDGIDAQQVAVPEHKPLTDEEAKNLLKNSDLLEMFETIGWYSSPRRSFNEHAMSLIRAVEAHRGITQGEKP